MIKLIAPQKHTVSRDAALEEIPHVRVGGARVFFVAGKTAQRVAGGELRLVPIRRTSARRVDVAIDALRDGVGPRVVF